RAAADHRAEHVRAVATLGRAARDGTGDDPARGADHLLFNGARPRRQRAGRAVRRLLRPAGGGAVTMLEFLLGALAGSAVGFTLGLVGGGGSILAVPLMVYLVGVQDPHVAIGTSALAVAANALIGLTGHARKRNVKWRCAAVFAT